MSKTIYLIAVFAAGLSSVIGCAGAAQNGIANFNVAFGVSANGEHIVFSSADGDLYLLNLKTSEVRQLTKTDAIETTPSFSPDGTRVAYAAHEKGAKSNFIFIRSLDGKQIQQLTNTPNVSDSTPSFSADGSQLTFKRAHRYRPYSMGGWTWDDWDVYVMDVDGKQRRRITQQKYYGLRTPRFSRDSKTVIYSADGRGVDNVHTIFEADVSGNNPPRPLTKESPKGNNYGAWASEPAIAPDGKRVAFISDRIKPFHYDVFIMDRDGTNPTALGVTNVSHYNSAPVFMPDGKSVLFLAGTESDAGNRPISSLWQVTAEGKNPRRIAGSDLFTRPLSWKPSP